MIHISKTKRGQFSVTNMAANGEVLKPSETFKRKQSCWVNIKSELKNCYDAEGFAIVQDNTGKTAKVYVINTKNRILSNRKPEKPHAPK